MAFRRTRRGSPLAAQARERAARASGATAEPVASDWFLPPSTVEVQEGGESLWDLWHEESSRMELAFAETQPASTPTHEAAALNHEELGEVLALARRGNRACPRPPAWAALHATLGGEGQADLAPPPLQPWVWRTLSSLQRRQRFSDHILWAHRHGKLAALAAFIAALPEAEWVHLGDDT